MSRARKLTSGGTIYEKDTDQLITDTTVVDMSARFALWISLFQSQ